MISDVSRGILDGIRELAVILNRPDVTKKLMSILSLMRSLHLLQRKKIIFKGKSVTAK